MIVYVLVRAFADGSKTRICGATEDREVAQAFLAGGIGVEPEPQVYQIDTKEDILAGGHALIVF